MLIFFFVVSLFSSPIRSRTTIEHRFTHRPLSDKDGLKSTFFLHSSEMIRTHVLASGKFISCTRLTVPGTFETVKFDVGCYECVILILHVHPTV